MRRLQLLYIAVVAGLSPLGLNAGVNLQPVYADASVEVGTYASVVALYTLGLGLGQPFAGYVSDRWGRRPAALGGLTVAWTGALICTMAVNSDQLLFGRLLTGLGLSTSLVVPRACVRDQSQGVQLQRDMAVLALVFAILPAITPSIAWMLSAAYSWRAPMALILLCISLVWISAWHWHHETRPAGTTQPGLSAWIGLSKNPLVRRVSLSFSSAAAPFFIMAAAGPGGIYESTGASSGSIAILLGLSYLGFALGNRWVHQKATHNSQTLFARGLGVVLAGMALLVTTQWWPHIGLWALALTIYAIGHGIVFPAAFALVLNKQAQQAGVTTAAIGTIHMTVGGLSAWLAGKLPLPADTAVVIACVSMAGLACIVWLLPSVLRR